MVVGCPKGINDWRKTVARKLISSEVDSISPDSQSLLSLQSFAQRQQFFQLGNDALLLGKGWEGKYHFYVPPFCERHRWGYETR